MDIGIRRNQRINQELKGETRTKRWNLNIKNFKDQVIKQNKWQITNNANDMLNDIARDVKRVLKNVEKKLK